MGESLRVKIWETLFDKGIGNPLKPWQIRREELARSQADRIKQLMIAQTAKDVKLLNDDGLIIDDKGHITYKRAQNQEFRNFEDICLDDEKERIIQKKINLLNTISTADSIADEKIDREHSGKPTLGWFERWRENAENSNTDDLRILWSKVICSECERQGSVSLRAMDFLRNLSQQDAKIIEKYSALNSGPMIIRCIGNPLMEENANLLPPEYKSTELMYLEELGVISSVNELGYSVSLRDLGTADKSSFRITIINIRINIESNKKIAPLQINGYRINKIGKELFNIIDSTADIKYADNIISMLNRKGFKAEKRYL
jgi:hypothetical protein